MQWCNNCFTNLNMQSFSFRQKKIGPANFTNRSSDEWNRKWDKLSIRILGDYLNIFNKCVNRADFHCFYRFTAILSIVIS